MDVLSHNTAIVAGSFDPVQYGHLWLITQAARLASTVMVVVSENKKKTHMFTANERAIMLRTMLDGGLSITDRSRVHVHIVDTTMIARFAFTINATLYVRGVRNGTDFQYEHEILEVNRVINPGLETVFVVPPRHLSIASSSMIKGLVGFEGWEEVAKKFTSPDVVAALREKDDTFE